VWREILIPKGIQAYSERFIRVLLLFIATALCTIAAAQDSTAIDSADNGITAETDVSEIDSIDTDSFRNEEDSAVEITGESDKHSTDSIRSAVLRAGKPAKKTPRWRKMLLDGINFTGAVIRKKLEKPLEKVSWISVHRNKLLFLTVSAVIIILTLSLYRERREKGRFLTTTRLSIMDKEVQRACRHIEEHYADPDCSLQSVCEALVTGEAFLDALFIKELGLSITDFITQVRINRAKIEMKKKPVPEIDLLALSVGYEDKEQFLASFTRITGTDYLTYHNALSGEKVSSDA
jgi:AraC-like DNA-binding protein